MTCPTCKRKVERRAAGKAYPFCSSRCALLDLGKWLGEEYRVAADDEGGDDPATAPSPGRRSRTLRRASAARPGALGCRGVSLGAPRAPGRVTPWRPRVATGTLVRVRAWQRVPARLAPLQLRVIERVHWRVSIWRTTVMSLSRMDVSLRAVGQSCLPPLTPRLERCVVPGLFSGGRTSMKGTVMISMVGLGDGDSPWRPSGSSRCRRLWRRRRLHADVDLDRSHRPTSRLAAGTTQQLSATATYSDASTQDVSGRVDWTTSDDSVATVHGAGLANGVTMAPRPSPRP